MATSGSTDLTVPARGGDGAYLQLRAEMKEIAASLPGRRVRHGVGGHTQSVVSLCMSRDASKLATGSRDKTARLWDVRTGRCLRVFRGHSGSVGSVFLVEGDKKLLTASRGRSCVKLWDAASGSCLETFGDPCSRPPRVFFPCFGGRRLTTVRYGKSLELLDLATARHLQTFSGDFLNRAPVFSADGQRMLTWGHKTGKEIQMGWGYLYDGRREPWMRDEQEARLWDVGTGRCLGKYPELIDAVNWVLLDHDGSRLFAHSENRAILWDLQKRRLLRTYVGHAGRVQSACLSSDGERLATGSADMTARLWCVDSGRCLMTFRGHDNAIGAVFLSADKSRLVTGSGDDTVRLWDVDTGECLMVYSGDSRRLESVLLPRSGRRLVTRSQGNTVRSWDLATGRSLHSFAEHREKEAKARHDQWPDSSQRTFVTEDGRRLATGGEDNRAMLWDLDTGRCLATFEGHTDSIRAVFLTAGAERLLTVSADRTAKLWGTATGRCLITIRDVPALRNVDGAFLSADGLRMIIECYGRIDIWDVATRRRLGRIVRSSDRSGPVLLSPDGTRLIATFAKGVNLYSVSSRERLSVLRGHEKDAWSACMNADGTRLYSWGTDGTVKIWDVASEHCLSTLRLSPCPLTLMQVDAEGCLLLTANESEHGVFFWDVGTGALLATLQNVNRGFLWTTPPDPAAPDGWIWTDREDLVHVLECDEDGGNPAVLDQKDPRRREYLAVYNNQKMVMSRIRNMNEYRLLAEAHLKQIEGHALRLEQERQIRRLAGPADVNGR